MKRFDIIRISMSFWMTAFFWNCPLYGQTGSDQDEIRAVSEAISGYLNELKTFSSRIPRADMPSLKRMDRQLESINFRWNAYMETQQLVIVENELLMAAMSAYNETFLSVSDSLANQKVKLEAVSNFKGSEKYICGLEKEYDEIRDKAFKLSLVKQTAPQLEKLKVKEQVTFQKAQQKYQEAQAAAGLNPSLSKAMKAMDDRMADVILKSEEIQAMEYKPFITRIKDYIMSLACVAVILMALSTVKSKWDAVKAKKDSAKKYKEMMRNEEYPTI